MGSPRSSAVKALRNFVTQFDQTVILSRIMGTENGKPTQTHAVIGQFFSRLRHSCHTLNIADLSR
jgi:hypothetical protein